MCGPAPIAVSPHPSLFRQASALEKKKERRDRRFTTRHPLNQERRSDFADRARIFFVTRSPLDGPRDEKQPAALCTNNFAAPACVFLCAPLAIAPSRRAVLSRLAPPRVVAPTIPKPSRDMCDPPPTATRPVRSRDDVTSARPTRRDVSAHDPMHAARASTTIADRLSKARRPRPVPRDAPRSSRIAPPPPAPVSTLDPRPTPRSHPVFSPPRPSKKIRLAAMRTRGTPS